MSFWYEKKDAYNKIIKDTSAEIKETKAYNRNQSIEGIKSIIERIRRTEGTFDSLSDGDLNWILLHLKNRDLDRKESSVICKCIKEEGLNQLNADKIVGSENGEWAIRRLRTMGLP